MKKRILFVGEASFLSTGFSTYYRELLQRLSATGKYEIAELGSYADDSHPDIQKFIAGRWKFYGGQPLPNDQANWQRFHIPTHPRTKGQPTNQFGEWRFDEVCADFQPDIVIDIRDWWMCFPANTDIMTRKGVIPIQDVSVGDAVLTHSGRYRDVMRTFSKQYSGDLYTVHCSHVGVPVSMTEEHPVLCYKRDNTKPTVLPLTSDIQPEWLPINRVDKYDLLCYPIPKERGQNDLRFWDISPSLARLIGYYAAEGCMMYQGSKRDGVLKGVQLTFGSHETDYVDDVCHIISGEYGLVPTVKHDDINNTLVVRVFNREMAEDIRCFVDGTARTKAFEGNVIHARRSIIACILCGLLRGDGCISEERGSYCTASKTLAHQVFNMMIALGIMPSYNLNENRLNEDVFHRYIFSVRAQSLDGFREVYDRGVVPTVRDTRRLNDHYAFLTVKSVDVTKHEDVVFNFEVEDDNSYVTSFAVHNCEYQERSCFRDWFKWVVMPTVDAEPQAEEWMATYENANLVLAYSDYGIDVLKSQSPKIRVFPTPMRPGVDLNVFRPDPESSRHFSGIGPEIPVIGAVMRNQSRKLYPDLIDAFACMKIKYKGEVAVDKAVLMIHSAWPDNAHSFDYPRHVKRLAENTGKRMRWAYKDIKSDVLQTFMCHNPKCEERFVGWAMNLWGRPIENREIGGKAIRNAVFVPCPHCGQTTATPPTTGQGFTREELAKVYNSMDLYVQCSICEGDGMPIQEAKACGVPTLVVDYTAMREKGRFPEYAHLKDQKDTYSCHHGGETIDVGRYYYEPETSCKRAHPDVEDMADKMRAIITDNERHKKMSEDARRCAEVNYNWDELVNRWIFVLDNIRAKPRTNTWDSPIEVVGDIAAKPIPKGLNNDEFIAWLYTQILCYERVDTEGAKVWMEHLQQGVPRERLLQHFVKLGNQQQNAHSARQKVRARVAGIEEKVQAVEWV